MLMLNTRETCLIRNNKNFEFSSKAQVVPILVSDDDYPGILRPVKHLQQDINAVTGQKPVVVQNKPNGTKQALIMGTIGKSVSSMSSWIFILCVAEKIIHCYSISN
jgi:hypothetical protein